MNRFTWDASKAVSNLRKHGVTFEEAATAFWDSLARIHDDPSHSEIELREILVGHSNLENLLVVSFVEQRGVIRIISARRATKNEHKDFQETR